MTTFVTGATGYIGSAVVRQLLETGKTVRCLVRETSSLKNLEGLDVETAYGDIRDMDSLRRALDGCDKVYHLAAIYANWLPDAGVMYQAV
jgi:dihydroflavonol-4-reductase